MDMIFVVFLMVKSNMECGVRYSGRELRKINKSEKEKKNIFMDMSIRCEVKKYQNSQRNRC